MPLAKQVFAATALLFCLQTHAEWPFPPLCYKHPATDREVALIGTNHLLPYRLGDDEMVDRLIGTSNLLFLENTATSPEDGVFGSDTKLPRELLQTVRADRFIAPKDLGQISRLIGYSLDPTTQLPIVMAHNLSDVIILIPTTGPIDQEVPEPMPSKNGLSTLESIAYAYAAKRKTRTLSLETLEEMYGLELEEFKKDISESLECRKNENCINSYKIKVNRATDYIHSAQRNTFSYDEVSQLMMDIPGSIRTRIVPRNRRMVKSLLTNSPNNSRSLVIVGAAHIGGPGGIASRLEEAEFEKFACNPARTEGHTPIGKKKQP